MKIKSKQRGHLKEFQIEGYNNFFSNLPLFGGGWVNSFPLFLMNPSQVPIKYFIDVESGHGDGVCKQAIR